MQNGYADPRHAALLQAQAALQVGSSLASRPPSVVKRLHLRKTHRLFRSGQSTRARTSGTYSHGNAPAGLFARELKEVTAHGCTCC